MQNQSEITISITLLSGDPIVFELEANEDRQRTAGARIEHSMNANYLGVELDGKLVIIPTNNIQKVEISPAPTAMISNVVKGAKLEPACPAFGACPDQVFGGIAEGFSSSREIIDQILNGTKKSTFMTYTPLDSSAFF